MDSLTARERPCFSVEGRSKETAARVGRLWTLHGELVTPAFFPVGTCGAVRGLTPQELGEVGVQGVLANTVHLMLRPGEDSIRQLGGLHRFMGWSGPILTDSGGFQIHSLDRFCKRSEEGVHFQNPVDGSRHFLSPERSMVVQEALGADLIVTLDEFEPIGSGADPPSPARAHELLERTLRWAQRCRNVQQRRDQLLFGIVQGGGFESLRRESAERTCSLEFEAYAVGGLGLGESMTRRALLLEAALDPLPEACPRYLMGLGLPPDLIEGVARGVDLFDCVVPTRHGRHGTAFTRRGPLHLRNARFRQDPAPLDSGCPCPVCGSWSRAYLRHLFMSNEMLGPRLLSLHNLAFYTHLLQAMRDAIADDRFDRWRTAWLTDYVRDASGGDRSGGSSAATHSAA